VAGDVDNRLILHDGRGDGIVGQQAMQLSEGRSKRKDVALDG
jgi:hypothetical protein